MGFQPVLLLMDWWVDLDINKNLTNYSTEFELIGAYYMSKKNVVGNPIVLKNGKQWSASMFKIGDRMFANISLRGLRLMSNRSDANYFDN